MTPVQVASPVRTWVVKYAHELGFDQVRIASAEPLVRDGRIAQERVRQGYMDGMPWFTEERVQRASDPQALLPGARSIITVALSYLPAEEHKRTYRQTGNEGDAPSVRPFGELRAGSEHVEGQERKEHGSQSLLPMGRVARYARWTDYHHVMKEKLRILASALPQRVGRPVRTRVFVDDSPLLERAVAQRAGLGWFGKNTNILTPTHGSWVFLGSLITDLELEPDKPLKKSCGDCILCIPACPTGAIVAPYVIDAPRCISYLTIECRGPIPRHLRPRVGDWVFGCDICQEVCPVNRHVARARVPELKGTGFSALELVPLLTMTQEEFASRFRNTPIQRAKRLGLQRNACVALGNIGDRRALPDLGQALRKGEPLVRGHAAWALGRLGGPEATHLLEQAVEGEADAYVRDEIEVALGELRAPALVG